MTYDEAVKHSIHSAFKAAKDATVMDTNELRAEIERLRAALLWIDRFDPETIAVAEEKFGLKLTK